MLISPYSFSWTALRLIIAYLFIPCQPVGGKDFMDLESGECKQCSKAIVNKRDFCIIGLELVRIIKD